MSRKRKSRAPHARSTKQVSQRKEKQRALAMSVQRPALSSTRSGRKETWRIERLVHRAAPHLDEAELNPRLLVLAGAFVVLVLLLGAWVWSGANHANSPARAPAVLDVTPAPIATRQPTPSPAPTVAPTVAVRRYEVQPGDTLTFIAAKFNVSVAAIMAANGLKDATIRAGQTLIIPASPN